MSQDSGMSEELFVNRLVSKVSRHWEVMFIDVLIDFDDSLHGKVAGMLRSAVTAKSRKMLRISGLSSPRISSRSSWTPFSSREF
jgi:hypothetical protein